MKISVIFYSILIAGLIGISGCGNEDRELKKDTKEIADVMCKTMGAMTKLKAVDPADSAMVSRLQAEYQMIQADMAKLYEEFRKKYGDKTTSKEFTEKFRKYLNESMLDCKNLSKEDREAFEKGMK